MVPFVVGLRSRRALELRCAATRKRPIRSDETVSSARRKPRLRLAFLGVIAVVAALSSFVVAPVTAAPEGGQGGLENLGVMPFDWKFPRFGSGNDRLHFFVDPSTHRGFLFITDVAGKRLVLVYDLQRLRRETAIPWPFPSFPSLAAVDLDRHRLFFIGHVGGQDLACDNGTTFVVLDTRRLTLESKILPCVDGLPFAVQGISYYAPARKLYAVGAPAVEQGYVYGTGADYFKERTFYLQIDPVSFDVDWVIDATSVCDWHGAPSLDAVVARRGDDLISFCYRGGYTYNYGGTRGQAVVIPLDSVESDAPVFHTSPTFTYPVTPSVDPETGRLLLFASGPPYGPAVWGFDPLQERFVGVAPAGEQYQGTDDRFRGFDPVTGRLYIVHPRGTAVINARDPALSGGETFPALSNMRGGGENGASFEHDIAIDGRLHRLFIPYYTKGGIIVVQDESAPPARSVTSDPDAGTADIPEVEGSTVSVFSGAADAFGVHFVDVGGIPGAIDNWDESCFPGSPVRDADPQNQDRCAAEQVFTTGNREYFLGQVGLELSSASGVSAFGSVFHVSSNDSATATDFRSLAACFSDRLPEQVPSDPRDGVASFCQSESSPLSQFRYGTQDPHGRDVPFPGSLCVDETGSADSQAEASLLGESSARCDSVKRMAAARADTAVLSLPAAASPLISVAHASSTVESTRNADGTVTTVAAAANGIRIGEDFSIGRVYAEATTMAHGRTGTTEATFKRVISDVHGPGIDCVGVCDPQAVVDAFNQGFASQARLRLPQPYSLKSRRGYQGLVVKDPGLKASDSVILNDDTDTFNALDVIFSNDGADPAQARGGPAARSLVLVSLAGVHAESRYGIFPIAEGGSGTDVVPPVPALPPLTDLVGDGVVLPPIGDITPPPTPVQVIKQVWRFIVNHPGQAALLFALLLLLSSPVYFGLRSRSLTRTLGT